MTIILSICLSLLPSITATAQETIIETGLATYYSARMHGHLMSDGSRYDKNGFTCAHRTFPFGTRLKVTNKKNGKTTIVRVADRGPFGKKLIVDLSNAAAAQIDMLRDGVVPVEIEVLPSLEEIWEEHLKIKTPEYLNEFQMDSPSMKIELEWGHSPFDTSGQKESMQSGQSKHSKQTRTVQTTKEKQ
ncbi:MAG: septal ring lytic transglycosylase RlpA family protein [Bacteroides sp.]|nr:septal ring lytic transglycosylase RlpA family protein [Bacteroides sp.]